MFRTLSLVAASSFLLGGCLQLGGKGRTDVPGDELGTYDLGATIGPSSCGAGALGAPDAFEFVVKLSYADGALFWKSGGDSIAGTVDESTGAFRVEASVTTDMRSEGQEWMPPCSIRRTDVSEGTLETMRRPKGLEGGLSYAFEPTAGSECSDLFLGDISEPLFATLPCQMSYAIVGQRNDLPAEE